MSHHPDQAETERLRIAEESLRIAETQRPPPPELGAPAFVGLTTVVGTYPTAANAFYMVVPLDVLGMEVEGSAGVTGTAGNALPAWNCGTAVPPLGTKRLIVGVPYRWSFQFDG